jgi:hypothetical protein
VPSSPGLLALLVAVVLGGPAGPGQGASATNGTPAAVTPVAATNAAPAAAEPLKDITAMTADELKAELEATQKAAAAAAIGLPALRQELWQLRQQAKRNNLEVQSLREQLDKLKARIEQTVDSLPGIRAKMEEEEQAKAKLADLMRRQQDVERLLQPAAATAGAGDAAAGNQAAK